MYMKNHILQAVKKIRGARYLSGFTGAGISVESGIPPFRGEGGLWNTYDPALFEIEYYMNHPAEAWPLQVKLFYECFEKARPNEAHMVLAELEKRGMLRALITQNIDNLHYRAGSRNLVEYHGNPRQLICTSCGKALPVTPDFLRAPVPLCDCSGLLKPDFVFFGENIPLETVRESERISSESDVMLVVGTTGLVYPAAQIPRTTRIQGGFIIEINPRPSEYTNSITDLFLQGTAVEIMDALARELLSGTG
jgi:NAD-dependent deacetylase